MDGPLTIPTKTAPAHQPSPSATITIDNTIFERNLAALRIHVPETARQIANTEVPPSARLVRSRDGSPNFRIQTPDGRTQWLGRSSTPQIRAQSLVDTFSPGGGNALVYPLGCGMEARVLLDRQPRHAAVFAFTRDPLEARLALTLLDWSDAISTGRFVPLVGDDAGTAITQFFSTRLGFECPQRALVVPYVEGPELDKMRDSMERAFARVAALHREQVEQLRVALAQSLDASQDTRPASDAMKSSETPTSRGLQPARTHLDRNAEVASNRLTVLTLDPRPSSVETINAIKSAADHADCRACVSIPDQPDKCHTVARLRTLLDGGAPSALLINCAWGAMREAIPPDFPAATWLLPGARLLKGLTDGFSSRHTVFAATPPQVRDAIAAGAAEPRVHLLEIGCDGEIFHPRDIDDQERFDVAVIGDVADLTPEACGIALTSHIALWKQVITQAAQRLDAPAPQILSAAERISRVALSDDTLRSQFERVIADRVLPTLTLRAAAQNLLDAGIDVHVFGHGWQFSKVPAQRVHPPPSSPHERNRLFNAARLVICPLWNADTAQRILEACLAGGCVLTCPPTGPLADLHPQLHDALSAVPTFDTLSAMRKTARSLLRDDDARSNACAQARRIISTRHLIAHRLAAIREAIQSLRITPGDCPNEAT